MKAVGLCNFRNFTYTHTFSRCLNYVKFPAGIAIVFNVSAGLTLILRTYALYGRATVRRLSPQALQVYPNACFTVDPCIGHPLLACRTCSRNGGCDAIFDE